MSKESKPRDRWDQLYTAAHARELLAGITPGPWKESLLDGVDYEDGGCPYRCPPNCDFNCYTPEDQR